MLINKYYLSPKSENGKVFDSAYMEIKIDKWEERLLISM